MDPDGLTRIRYYTSIETIVVIPENGQPSYYWRATSGEDGCECDDTVKNKGPIPDGLFFILSSEVQELTTWETIKRNRPKIWGGGDWGSRNVLIHPMLGTETHDRNGFYLHEGMFDGSAGCIDVGGGMFGSNVTERLFEDIKNDPDGYIPLTVH